MINRLSITALIAIFLGTTSLALAVDISSDQALTEAGATVLDGDAAGDDITPIVSPDSLVYDWGDVNGDGTRDDSVANAGLNVGSFRVYTPYTSGTNVEDADLTLNLNGGNITGQGVWDATPYHTRNDEEYWAEPRYLAISTQHSDTYDPDAASGDINVINVGNLSVGTISTHQIFGFGSGNGNAGAIRIGEAAGTGYGVAGNVRVDNLDAQTDRNGSTGGVHVYSGGFVKIQDGDNDGTATLGTIYSRAVNYNGGMIEVYHEGDFRAGRLLANTGAYTYGSGNHGGTVILDGNYDGDDTTTPLGDAYIQLIDTSYYRTSYGDPNNDITVSGYDTVTIDKLWGFNLGANGDSHGSNATITAVTSITIGEVDLGVGDGGGHAGDLTLTATGSTISLGALDLDLVRDVRLDASGGTSIAGDLTGFDTSGSDTQLRNVAGQQVTYDPFAAGNGYLGAGTYQLVNLDNTGAGGLLTPDATTRTWKGDDTSVWSGASFDDAGANAATASGEIAVFDDNGDTQAVSVETGSEPTAGAIRLAGSSAYSLDAGGGTITLDSGGGPVLLVADSASVDHAIAAPIALGGDLTANTAHAGQGVDISGDISGAHTLTKYGDGFLTLSGSNSHTTTTVEAGTLNVGANGLGSGTTTVNAGTLNATAAVDMGGADLNLVGGQVTGTSFTTTGHYNVQAGTVGAALGGSAGLTKTTAGTVTLSGANTYAGDTTVDGGVLEVTGSLSASSAVYVNGGGQLTGTGSVGVVTYQNGAVVDSGHFGGLKTKLVVADGGILRPGASPGTLVIGGAGEWGSGGILEWEVNDANELLVGTDPGFDAVGYTGDLSITATEADPFTIKLISLDAGNSPGLAANFDPSSSYSWNIAAGSSVSGFDASKFSLDTGAFLNSTEVEGFFPGSFSVSNSGAQVFLNYTPGAAAIQYEILVDVATALGDADTADTERTWNLVTSSHNNNGDTLELVRSDGTATDIELTITSNWDSTNFAGGGTWDDEPKADWILDEMTGDSYTTGQSQTQTLQLSGLDPEQLYTIEILSSRSSSGSRTSDWTLSGLLADQFSDGDISDNFEARVDGYLDQIVMTWTEFQPDASGVISIEVDPLSGHFGYLNGIRITYYEPEVVPEPATVALLSLGGLALGAAARRRRKT